MNRSRTYEDACRDAATAQGLDPIAERLATEGIPYTVEQTGGFVMLIRIPLAEPTWLAVTASDDHPDDSRYLVRYHDDAHEGTMLAWEESYDWPADQAVTAIREHIALAHTEAVSPARRLVNACVVYCYPTGRGGTYTVVGSGAWGRPEEALDYAQRQREIFHERHGAALLTTVPWYREGGYGGLPAYFHPPGAAVGVEIHDVRTDERWFVQTNGPQLGPIGSREPIPRRWQPMPPDLASDVEIDQQPTQAAADHPQQQLQRRVDDLRQRLDASCGAAPPEVSM
ncbi:MAG: hypothetical protein ACRDJP_04920 [Actinomycetota bacterium]